MIKLPTYPGGKNGQGVYQSIIALMPPHQRYAEPFLGHGAVMRRKAFAAAGSVGIDADAGVVERWRSVQWPSLDVHQGDGIEWLATSALAWSPGDVIYCDPPYVLSTRTKKRIYRFELSDADHVNLLHAIKRLECRCIISGYDCALYRRELAHWSCQEIQVMTRGGKRTERIWFNYDAERSPLHDAQYAGTNYRDRLRIKRKVKRWAVKFRALAGPEQQAILSALTAQWIPASDMTLADPAGLLQQRQT